MKFILIIGIVGVLAALGSAGVFMLRRPKPGEEKRPDNRMARALALRVAISVTLFVIILVSWYMGWISPKGIPSGR
jgi:Protein of unknown function (DUF2909)